MNYNHLKIILKKNILIIGPTSEIAKNYISEISNKFNVFSISRKKFSNVKIINNLILDQTKDLDKKKLMKLFGNIKFLYVIFFASNQLNTPNSIEKIKNTRILNVLSVNSIFPIKLTYFLIKKNVVNINAKFIYFSSRSGSITERGTLKHHKPLGNHVYKASKSLLNSFVKNISFEFKKSNYIFVCYHPGWVATKSAKGKMSVKKSVFYFNEFFNNLKKKDTGNFFNFDRKKILW